MSIPYRGIVHENKIEFDPSLALPDGSQVYLIPFSVLDEQTARRRVNHWLLRETPEQVGLIRTVGYLYQRDHRVVWRFEVTKTRLEAQDERIGQVDLEAQSGQILNSQQTFETLLRRQPVPSPVSEIPYTGRVQNQVVIFDPRLALSSGSQVELVPTTLVDEWTARRKANGWLGSYVGNVSTGAGRELLRIDNQAVWRFEGFATRRGARPVGPLGQVLVEAQTGQILTPLDEAEAIIERAAQLFRELAHEPE
jgi:hypothetical protein